MTDLSATTGGLVHEVLAVMRAAGLNPGTDADGDVEVLLADQRLYVRCVPTRPAMLRVFGHWLLAGEADEITRLRAANAVTGAVNLVKVSVDADRLAVVIDLVVAPGLDLRGVLPAALDAVLGSARTWHETVDRLLGGDAWPDGPPR